MLRGQCRGKTDLPHEVWAYMAGFLDGDGCIMAQLVRRNGYRLGFQVRASIVFYQHQSHKEILFWLKGQLGYGYIRDRNDAMCEYAISRAQGSRRGIDLAGSPPSCQEAAGHTQYWKSSSVTPSG